MGRKELQMVVLHRVDLVNEFAPVQALRSTPDCLDQRGCRVTFAFDHEVVVTDHVNEDEGAYVLERSILARSFHVVAAAVCMILSLPFDDRFLAVEEEQLDRDTVDSRLQRARELDQERRARTAVVGADERELLEELRVVVAADHQSSAA